MCVFLACKMQNTYDEEKASLSVVGQVLVSTCKCRDRGNLILPKNAYNNKKTLKYTSTPQPARSVLELTYRKSNRPTIQV